LYDNDPEVTKLVMIQNQLEAKIGKKIGKD